MIPTHPLLGLLRGPSIDWLRYVHKNTGRGRGDRALRSQHKREAARKQREKMKRHNRHQKKINPNWGKR